LPDDPEADSHQRLGGEIDMKFNKKKGSAQTSGKLGHHESTKQSKRGSSDREQSVFQSKASGRGSSRKVLMRKVTIFNKKSSS